MSSKRATVRYTSDRHSPRRQGPKLDDVASDGRVAIFDPERCENQGCWIQIDERHVIGVEEAR